MRIYIHLKKGYGVFRIPRRGQVYLSIYFTLESSNMGSCGETFLSLRQDAAMQPYTACQYVRSCMIASFVSSSTGSHARDSILKIETRQVLF